MQRLFLLSRLSCRNVSRNRYRSIYAFTTIAMGALGLFIFMGFNRGLMNQYRANAIRARCANGQLCTVGYRTATWVRPCGDWIQAPEGTIAGVRRLPGFRVVFHRFTLNALP